MPQALHIGIHIDCPWRAAYAFAHRPDAFAQWAQGLAHGLHPAPELRGDAAAWVRDADTPAGRARVRFTPSNAFGVLDHSVHLPDGQVVEVPLRIVPHGDACEVVLTLLRQPGMSDADFARDAQAVERDLQALRQLLEAPGGPAAASTPGAPAAT